MTNESAVFRSRAADERKAADAAVLQNVRERCERAETAWLKMADRADRTAAMRARNEAARPKPE